MRISYDVTRRMKPLPHSAAEGLYHGGSFCRSYTHGRPRYTEGDVALKHEAVDAIVIRGG
jgi:hypothetical protein